MQRSANRKIIFGTLVAVALISISAVPQLALAGDISGILQTAQRQFNSGNYSAAISTLQSGVSQSPSSAEVYFWLGRSYYELHDYENAIAQAEKSVQLDPKNSEYHKWLGIAYGDKADRESSMSRAQKVKKEFQEAVRLNPSNIQARRDLEEYCIDAPWIVGGSKDEARDQVEAVAALDPVEGHLARAVLYQTAMKKPELAEAEYREALKAKPRKIEEYFEVAAFFVKENKPADVDATVQAAAQLSANDPRLNFYRAVSKVLSSTDLPRAEEFLKSYLASTPERSEWPSHASAREWLGRLYEGEGKRVEAAEQYRAALQLDPGQKEAKARLKQLEKKSR